MADLLITRAMDWRGDRMDVLVSGERVAAVGPPGGLPVHDQAGLARRVELPGMVLLPAPAEPHAHLDKALLSSRVRNQDGDLAGALAAMRSAARCMTFDDVLDRARRAAALAVRRGFTAIRSHVDVGKAGGTAGARALAALRGELAGRAELQLAALITDPVTGRDGAAARAMLREALTLGCDLVGGAPWLGADPAAGIDELTAAAADAGCPIDLHLDETTEAASLTIRHYARRVERLGLGGRATASHCVSLGQQNPADARGLAKLLATAGVAVVTLPQTNLALQGRGLDTAVPRALPPVGLLDAAGVLVAAGGDNWRDPFNPVGRIDPMETAALVTAAAHLPPERAYDLVSANARAVLGLPPARLRAGDQADFLAIRAADLTEAVADGTEHRMVWHRGRQVATTTVRTA